LILLVQIIQLAICIWIFLDDLKNREISIYAVLCLLISGFIYPLLYSDITVVDHLYQGLQNTMVLSLIFGITFLYFKVLKKVENPFQTHLGVGDLLFFLSLVFVGPIISFIILFLAMSIFSSIVGALGIALFKWKTIPLAGLGALLLLGIRIWEMASGEWFGEVVIGLL
jgi:hypothetical protein